MIVPTMGRLLLQNVLIDLFGNSDEVYHIAKPYYASDHSFISFHYYPDQYLKINPEFNSTNDTIVIHSINSNINPEELEKDIPEKNDIELKEEPKIGMTADEVRNSSWGSPEDINKTTTEFGVSEQWVYGGKGYIYLEDGVVTAIQE